MTTLLPIFVHSTLISGPIDSKPSANEKRTKGTVSFHFKVPICDLWENDKIYDIDSCRDYICGLNPLTASHFFIEFIIFIAYFQEAIA
jgi:hypothetical protein